MCEKSSFSSDALLKNICVSLSLSNWMNYTFILGWINNNLDNLAKAKTILNNEGFICLIAGMFKEIFSLGPLSIFIIFIKGLLVQISFVLKAVKALTPLIILLAVIYFFYFRKK